MKNLLVTGGAGFIGSNFIRYILEETDFNGRIINVDKLTYAGNLENLAGISEKFKDRYVFVHQDICEEPVLAEIFSNYQVDSICHFAAESHVDRSIEGSDEFIRTNILGTFNLLELARKNRERLQLFHHISTDEVYGSLGEQGYFTENTPYHPNSPYSASKAASDHLVHSYHATFELPITISNCSNNYGPYHFPEKLIPLIILNALEEKELPVYGDGQHVRDWLYVRDHCRAIWMIMQQGRRGESYNVGGHNEMANLKVVEMVCDQLDELKPAASGERRRHLIRFVKDRLGHDRRYAIDYHKLNQGLGYEPEESFETGLHKTIQWYLDHQDWVQHVKSGEYQNWQ